MDASASKTASRVPTSLANALSLLRLFSAETPNWTIDEVVEETGLSRSTVYRYFRDLVSSGLLFVVSGKFYELGPTIVELDNLIQRCDPLLRALPAIAHKVRQRNQYGIVVHRLYNMRVVCVFTDDADRTFQFNYKRGDPVPLFSESTSRIMIAQLPLRRLRDLYRSASDEIREHGLGADWPSFNKTLKDIRRNGCAITRNVEKAQTRISAPIFGHRRRIIASFSQSLPSIDPDPADIEALSALVRHCGEEISRQVALHEEAADRK